VILGHHPSVIQTSVTLLFQLLTWIHHQFPYHRRLQSSQVVLPGFRTYPLNSSQDLHLKSVSPSIKVILRPVVFLILGFGTSLAQMDLETLLVCFAYSKARSLLSSRAFTTKMFV
jgi:hypothetical protein